MKKAFSSLCLFVLLICSAGSALADRPKLAVLGLEVAPGPGGTVDPATTQIAKDITNGLRTRAQGGASPYMLAPNSNKELTDEKLLMSCDNEGKDCMAVIGAGLAADMLLYGRVERKGEQYRVTLKLLDVKAKTVTQAADETPVGGAPVGAVKRLYGKLVGETGGGTLVIVAHVSGGAGVDGKVMIDDDHVGDLAGGKLTATAGEGRHTVAIEAGGYRRYEEKVTIHSGQQTKLEVSLVERGAASPVVATPSSSASTTPWKVTFGAGVAVAALSGAFAAYAHSKVSPPEAATATPVGSGDCGKSDTEIGPLVKNLKAFRDSCTWNTRTNYAFVGVGVGAAAAVIGAIMWYRGAKTEEHAIALAPVITPDQAGAALSFRW
jgi:hypothetical protein